MPTTGTNTNLTVNYNNNSPQFSRNGATDLNNGDTLTILLSGFPSGASIDTVAFDHNTVINGTDNKDTSKPAGSWSRRGGGTSTLTAYSCTGQSDGSVVIEDVENNNDDDKYWFSININGTGGPWGLDPELINKGSKGG